MALNSMLAVMYFDECFEALTLVYSARLVVVL